MADGLGEPQAQPSKKTTRNHMATEVCFINGATPGIGPHIAQGRLAERNQFAAIDLKWVSKPIAPELAHRGQIEMAALLPSIAVVFTVAGPVVYETKTPSVRVTDETNDPDGSSTACSASTRCLTATGR